MLIKEHNQIAIIVPAYNREKYIVECLNSCVEQELPKGWGLSVIMVDDGSKDRTLKTVIDYYKMDFVGEIIYPESVLSESHSNLDGYMWQKNNVFALSIENSERGAARNRGAEFALKNLKATWLLFIDSDDKMAKNGLVPFIKKIKSLENKKIAGIVADYQNWDGNSKFGQRRFNTTPKEGDLSEISMFERILSLSCTLVKSDFFIAGGGFPEDREMSGSEDWAWLVKLSFLGDFYYSDHICFYYRQYEMNTNPEKTHQSILKSRIYIANEIDQRFSEEKAKSLKKKMYVLAKSNILGAYTANLKPKKAIQLASFWIIQSPLLLFNLKFVKSFLSAVKNYLMSFLIKKKRL